MPIIRNQAEEAIHNARTDAVLGADSAAAARARQRHADLLAWWGEQPAAARARFCAFFGIPPTWTDFRDQRNP